MHHEKKAGVWYAETDDGLEIPVIDVTHPAFAIETSPRDIQERTMRFIEESRARLTMPPAAQAATMEALKGSRLGRALLGASGGFLDSVTTYLMKLGPDNLGSFASDVDRRIAASFPAWTNRLRVQVVAQLLAEGLTPLLDHDRARPLTIVDVAGGTAADAINALLLLCASHAGRLESRPIAIRVFDGDPAGPAFGRRALAALGGPGAPLHGLDARLEFVHYDWNDTSRLATELRACRQAGAAVAVSSEGGLFEYGTDDAIRHNLAAVREHGPADAIVVGSVTREDGIAAETRPRTNLAIYPRSVAQFAELASSAGWQVDSCVEGPLSRQVLLKSNGDARTIGTRSRLAG